MSNATVTRRHRWRMLNIESLEQRQLFDGAGLYDSSPVGLETLVPASLLQPMLELQVTPVALVAEVADMAPSPVAAAANDRWTPVRSAPHDQAGTEETFCQEAVSDTTSCTASARWAYLDVVDQLFADDNELQNGTGSPDCQDRTEGDTATTRRLTMAAWACAGTTLVPVICGDWRSASAATLSRGVRSDVQPRKAMDDRR